MSDIIITGVTLEEFFKSLPDRSVDPFYVNLPDLRGMSKKEAAHTLYEHLKRVAVEEFEEDESDVLIAGPGERLLDRETGTWWVCWEGGPFNWAIPYMSHEKVRTDAWYLETQWGCDVLFCEID